MAKARVAVDKAGIHGVTLKLTKQGKKLLKALRKKGKRARLTLQNTIRTPGAKPVTAKRTFTVKPRKAKKKKKKKRRK